MKAWKLAASLAAVLMVFAGTVEAQSSATDGQSLNGQTQSLQVGGFVTADTTSRTVRTTSTGAFRTSDESRDRDYSRPIVLLDGTDSTAVGMADSTALFQASDVLHGSLFFKLEGFGRTVRLAVQIRAHTNATYDTSSTYAVPCRASDVASAGTPDSLTVGGTTAPTAVAANNTEFIIEAMSTALAATKWGFPAGIVVPLTWYYNGPIYAPYYSIRVRNLSSDAAVKVKLSYYGSPL